MMGQAVQERGGHFGVTEDGGPFAEGEVGGDDHGGSLVKFADEVEQQLAAGLSEGEIAQIEHDEAQAVQAVGRRLEGRGDSPVHRE